MTTTKIVPSTTGRDDDEGAERPLGSMIRAGRAKRARKRVLVTTVLAVLLVAVFLFSLVYGSTVYSFPDVFRVILGHTVPGASFTVGELRLPRAVMGVLCGFAFGAAGVTFQTLLRNPLASPDIIGVSAGAAAAAVTGIVVFSLGSTAVSALALIGALVTALAIYALSNSDGFTGTRFILIGIGLAAMLHSVISYVLSRAAAWDMQAAMRWITGSLNGATWSSIMPLAIAFLILVPSLLIAGNSLGVLQLGDETARALGLPVVVVRVTLIIVAVALLAFATAAAGPISFVAFMSGPIAVRLLGDGTSPILASGLVGALLVLMADLVGQYLFAGRYPVGVITGALGAPYLILLLIRMNRIGSR